MSRETKLIKNTGIYFVGNFASKVLTFLLLPLYTYYLQADEFGYVNLFVTAASFLVPIFSMQIVDAAYRFMLDSKNLEDNRRVISNSISVYSIGMSIFMVICLIVVNIFKIKFGNIFCFYSILVFLFQLVQQMSRGMRKNVDYAISGIILTFIQAISNVIFIVSLDMKSSSLMIAPIVASIVGIIYLELRVGVLRKFSAKLVSKESILELLQYSIPLIPNTMSWWFISSFGTYFLTFYYGRTDFSGIFDVANKFPTLITMLNSIFFLAWQESAITEYNSEDRNEYYSKMFNSFSRLQLSVVIFSLPIIWIYINVAIGIQFKEAWLYVPAMLLGAVFSSYSNFIGTGYMSTKQTKGAFKTTIIAATTSVILNVLLIPKIGLMGISISVCLSNLLFWIIRIFDTRRFFKIYVNYRSMISIFCVIFIWIVLYYKAGIVIQVILIFISIGIAIFLNKEILKNFLFILKKRKN